MSVPVSFQVCSQEFLARAADPRSTLCKRGNQEGYTKRGLSCFDDKSRSYNHRAQKNSKHPGRQAGPGRTAAPACAAAAACSAKVDRHGSGAAGGLVLREQPPHDGERRTDLGEHGAWERDGQGCLLPAAR
jgi:hypothetical protein